MISGNSRSLRTSGRRKAVVDATRLDMAHETRLAEEIGRRAADRPHRAVGRAFRTWEAAAVVALMLLGLYAVWAPMVPVTPAQAWVLYAVTLTVGVVGAVVGLRRGMWLPLGLLLANWIILAGMHPFWSAWDTTHSRAVQEAYAMRSCALNSTAVALIAGGFRNPPRVVRWLWAVVIATLVVMATGEVVTGRHFTPTGRYAPPDFSPSGPFGNPNNLVCVLVIGLGIVLGHMSERTTNLHRAVLGAAAALLATLIVLTLSRSALLAAALVVLAAAALAISRDEGGRRKLAAHGPTWRRWTAAALVVAVGAVLAAVSLRRVFFPGDPETVRADGLRKRLIELALGYWTEHPWTGVGGGRFEILLRKQHPEVGHVLPVHNTFIEFLAEYGVVCVAALALLLVLAVATLVTTGQSHREPADGRPTSLDAAGTRYLAFVMLVGIVLAGLVMSSALNWQPWWMMIASLAVLTGNLRERRRTGRSRGSAA